MTPQLISSIHLRMTSFANLPKTQRLRRYYRSHLLKITTLLSLLIIPFGCVSKTSPSSKDSLNRQVESSLGAIQGELRLPEDQQCHTFTAYSVDSNEAVFSINVEQANLREYRYSFLQAISTGTYHLRGQLECIDSSGEATQHESLYVQFEVLHLNKYSLP